MQNSNEIKQLISNIKNLLQSPVWLMPENYEQQKEKFLNGEIKNPQFIYPTYPVRELETWLFQLEKTELISDGSLEDYILDRQIREISLKVKLLIYRDRNDFFDIVKKLYPCLFLSEYVENAKKDVLALDREGDGEIIDASQFRKIVKNYLAAEYGINNWEINLIERDDFTVKLQPRYKKIFISKFLKQKPINVEFLLAHEIDTHLVRGLNMHNQTGVLARQFPFYLKTEEGLACFLSDYCTENGEISCKKHAAKYLSGLTAKNNDFRTVYEQLLGFGLNPKLAFKRAFRLKRGLSDTSKPGLFTKEATYYEGMLEVKNYIDGNGDINKLFAGKIGLEDLAKIKDYNIGIIPKRLQKYTS